MSRFLRTSLNSPAAFLVDEVPTVDEEAGIMTGVTDTTRWLPTSSEQRGDPDLHPRHVSGPELLLVTSGLHAHSFHGCKWNEGWVGFRSRVPRADLQDTPRIGAPLQIRSGKSRKRVSDKRAMLRYSFTFTQEGREVCHGDQSAMFVRGAELG